MPTETITRSRDLLIRRQVLAPGEATPWHTDATRRFTVVVRGSRLGIEYRDGSPRVSVELEAGQVDWDDPEPRVHRALNLGEGTYEEVVTWLLTDPDMDPQPEARLDSTHERGDST